MSEGLQNTLRQLRLSGLATTLDVRLQEAGGNHLTQRFGLWQRPGEAIQQEALDAIRLLNATKAPTLSSPAMTWVAPTHRKSTVEMKLIACSTLS